MNANASLNVVSQLLNLFNFVSSECGYVLTIISISDTYLAFERLLTVYIKHDKLV